MKTIAYNYNKNITLIKEVKKPIAQLRDNQYYALMICDTPVSNDTRRFFNEEKGWVGLECTSPSEIYISKIFANRHSPMSGDTFLVEVKDASLCYELTF